MMRIMTILLVGIFVLSIGSLALANENKGHVCLRALDANQDGQVIHDEYHDSQGHGST